jgi:hypothetical protein
VTNNNPNRRDFLKTVGAALGGVSLLGHGPLRGRALGSIPNSYKFYRVLTANEGGSFNIFPNQLGTIAGCVMMVPPSGSDLGHLIVHGTVNPTFGPPAHAVFRVTIHFGVTPPAVVLVLPLATEGKVVSADGRDISVGHIGPGACNSLGEYVTTFAPNEPRNAVSVANSPGVYLFRPQGNAQGTWSRLIGFADQAPDGSFYGGDFGDVAVDDNENLLLVAATTHSPADRVAGFSGSQALIATSFSRQGGGRVVLQTGDLLPSSSSAIESIGIVDLAADHAFAAQVSARLLGPNAPRSGTALVVGNTQAASGQRTVAASPELISAADASRLKITSGHTFFGPRVDPQQDVAYVTHVSDFKQSVGSNNAEILGYYSRGSSNLLRQTQIGASSNQVIGLGAPCIDSTGLMYGTELMGDGRTRLFISDGQNSHVVLRSGDTIEGLPNRPFNQKLPVTEILFGQHSAQVDAFGRIAFTAEFSKIPNRDPQRADDVITGLVIGIPE